MFKLQSRAMQAQSAQDIASTSISLVSCNGMPAFGQVHTNLMLASGFQSHLQHRGLCIAFQDADMCDRLLSNSCISCRIHAERRILREQRANRKLLRQHPPFRNRSVDATRTMILELILQVLLCLFRFCEYKKAGGFTIQTMHDEEFLG